MRRVLEGDGLDVDRRLQERQAVMVERLAFEQAGRLQRQREALERALRGIRRLRAAQTTHAVLAYPAPTQGRVRLWGVSHGAVVAEKEVAARSFTLNRSLQFLAAVAAAEPPEPPLPAAAIDEILLVHGWLQRHAEAVHVLDVAALCGRDDGRARRHSTPPSPVWPRSSSPACGSAARRRPRTTTRTKPTAGRRPPERTLAGQPVAARSTACPRRPTASSGALRRGRRRLR